MTRIAFIRHGATDWNAENRIQGRTDCPLSARGIAQWQALKPPAELAGWLWLTSPLQRATETARCLGISAAPDARLIEMDWGAWEGLTRETIGPFAKRLTRRGAGGLDLQPPGGESPRTLQDRLRPLLAEIGAQHRPHACVTHKGVIRAALSLATGWDMTTKPPARLDWRAYHVFDAEPDGKLTLIEANRPFEPVAKASA